MTRLSRFLLVMFGAGFGLMALWGAYTFTLLNEARANPPDENAQAIRDLQTSQERAAKQCEAVQQTVASDQSETKRLSEQVASLTSRVDGLLESFASAQQAPTQEPARSAPAKRKQERPRGRTGGLLPQKPIRPPCAAAPVWSGSPESTGLPLSRSPYCPASRHRRCGGGRLSAGSAQRIGIPQLRARPAPRAPPIR